jgi:xanthosine utilization system XapX-like protein
MTIASAIALVVLGVLDPFVIALFQSESWSTYTKRFISYTISALTGIAYVILSGIAFTPANVLLIAGAFIVGVIYIYNGLKAVGFTDKILDALTSITITTASKVISTVESATTTTTDASGMTTTDTTTTTPATDSLATDGTGTVV